MLKFSAMPQSLKHVFSFSIFLQSLVLLLFVLVTTTIAENKKSHILYLNSYNPGYKWSSNIEKGLLATFDSSNKDIELSIEYLDTRRFTDTVLLQQHADMLKAKYSVFKQDLIIVSDNAAFSFALKNREQLFPDLPIVFCGYNNFHPDVLNGKTNITGVNEEMDITELVNTALHLQPKLEKLVFLLSTTDPSSEYICRKFEESTYLSFKDAYEIILLKDIPQKDIDSVLSTLSPESALFLLGQPKHADSSEPLSPVDDAIMISTISPVPVYTLWDFHMNTGVLGGQVLTGFDQGKAAANMAVEILNGKSADHIPVMMESPASTIFDYNTMKRFDIEMKSLPDGCTIINKPVSFYEEHRALVWNVVIIIITLSILIVLLSLNILRRRKVEKELRNLFDELNEEKRNTDDFLDSAPGLFYLYDDNWQLIRWNKAHRDYTGYSDEELYGRRAISWVEGADQDKVRKTLSNVLVDGIASTEIELIKKDGTKIPMALTGKRVDVNGKHYMCGIGIDISDKRQLEAEVRQSQKMEALGTIASGIAHDLNNVIAGLMGFSEIVKDDLEAGTMPDIDHVDNIINASERASGIVRQILIFSRKSSIDKTPIRLRALVNDVISLIERTIPKSIEIKKNVSDDGLSILADLNQIHQVIMNLCTNAWHSMRDTGGAISVSLYHKEVKKREIPESSVCIPGIYECIEITDTGCGIEEGIQDKIFEPFYTTKEEGEGTGLGLSVVNNIIKSHDGFITLESKVGCGTTFKVYFPVTDQEQVSSVLDTFEVKDGGTETILVVDDEPQLREATVVVLSRLGYHVLSAEDGVEGLNRFKHNEKDIKLVLTDLAMPKMAGDQMAKEIRKVSPSLPIILCTGYSKGYEKLGTSHDVFNTILNKPVRKNKLAKVIRSAIDGEIAR
jgi:two-component system cell cycle sensor histidine kinase/response regulator CckA